MRPCPWTCCCSRRAKASRAGRPAFWASHRFERVSRASSLTIALLDMPMVFFLQSATFESSLSASGIAGFTVGVYVLPVISPPSRSRTGRSCSPRPRERLEIADDHAHALEQGEKPRDAPDAYQIDPVGAPDAFLGQLEMKRIRRVREGARFVTT